MNRILWIFTLLCSFYAIAQEDTDAEATPLNYDLEGMTIERKISLGKVGDKIILEDLNFIGGTYELLPDSEPVLKKLLKIMVENPNLKIQIQGHVCCFEEKWHEISSARAQYVHHYLKKNGIKKDRISYKDFGGSKPIYPIPEENEAQRGRNRRVEIEIIEL